jgi:hypothetical protein
MRKNILKKRKFSPPVTKAMHIDIASDIFGMKNVNNLL